MAVRPRFDPKRPLVAARDFTFMGVAYTTGDPFNPEGASDRLRARQYEARAVNFGEGEAESTEQVQMTGPKGGRYTITAPWLDEPETVRGKAPAEKRLAELRAEGPPLGFIEGGSAVTVEGGEGGWYEVNAPWLDEPEKVQGRDEAEARQRELHEAGEPDTYRGYTLTAGENGWYHIAKEGVADVALNVQGEDKAREAVAQLRAGETPEDTALPEGWTVEPAAAGEQQPDTDVEGEGNQAPEETTVDDTNKDKQTADTAPNEPGTNEPNGAEVINDETNADNGGGEDDEGDTRPVGP